MPLILAHDRVDLGEFSSPVPQRFGVPPAERSAAPTARGRHARDHSLALFGRNHGPLVLLVPGLSAATTLRLRSGRNRLGVRTNRRRRKRRVGRVLAAERRDLGFEFSDARRQTANLSRLPFDQGENFGR